MKKKRIATLVFMVFMLTGLHHNVFSLPVNLNFEVRGDDPTTVFGGPKRTPLNFPEITLDGHTLAFITPCDGNVLILIGEDGEVVYTTIITTGTITLCLPSFLEGFYELQIICGNRCFYADIELL